MADGTWSLAEAKAKFSELVERARSEGPQRVTRNGKDAAFVVSPEEWAKLQPKPETLYDFLARSPLRGTDIKIERLGGELRDLDL